MPLPFQLTPRALNDLDIIWSFIVADSIDAANRVESAILAACNSLARNPRLGSKRIEITSKPVRFWTVSRFPNFIVVYRPETRPLHVVAILHGRRNLKALLSDPGTL
jgi:plasmid stabilization system protein ParE